jgi:hypothetical protein
MSAMRQLFWPALALVAGAISALLLRAVALAAIRRWARGPSALRAVGDSIRMPSLLWCLVLGLYVGTEIALEFSELPPRLHNRLSLFLQAAVIASVTFTLAGLVNTIPVPARAVQLPPGELALSGRPSPQPRVQHLDE